MVHAQLGTEMQARQNRLLAFVVDFLLLSVVTAVVWGVFFVVRAVVGMGSMLGAAAMDSSGAMVGASLLGYGLAFLQWAVIALVVGGYFVFFLSNDGQTLGMKLTDVVVAGEDGSACTRPQAVKRTAVLLAPLPVMAVVSVVVPLLGFPLAVAMMGAWLIVEAVVLFLDDERGQRIGDRLADTVVVQAAD